MEREDIFKEIFNTIRKNLLEIRLKTSKMRYEVDLSKSTESIYLTMSLGECKRTLRFSDHKGRPQYTYNFNWAEDGSNIKEAEDFIKTNINEFLEVVG